MNEKISLVRNAMLAVQRYPWEQGVCAQVLWEMGDTTTAVAMAHDAVLRQQEDGRLAVTGENIAVTDPAANGEAVWRAYELTGREMYRDAAEKMLDYLLHKAPRTDEGIICHNEVTFHEGFSERQVWVDSVYMAPPFLAVMGQCEEALRQIEGYISYLIDQSTGLLYHIYDTGTKRFVRKKLWATGNGWALLGIGRVIDTCIGSGRNDIAERLIGQGRNILDAMFRYQLPDGRFHDILDDSDSFAEGAGAMMMAAFIYRGICGGWLDAAYAPCADKVRATMDNYVDSFGIIHEVCGCPHFVDVGTSAESMAAYLMMHAHYEKANSCRK
ncbi:MAG: glycosyl hydrolase [Ruminococcaceae bacterium]|nr:glycosyl hydrolase [Oscillospiraceae bacterium]